MIRDNKKEWLNFLRGRPYFVEGPDCWLEVIERNNNEKNYIYFQESKNPNPKYPYTHSIEILIKMIKTFSNLELESCYPKSIYRMKIE